MFIYPSNLKARPKMWLWELHSLAIIGIGLILSVFALANGLSGFPLILTFIYGFLSIKVDDTNGGKSSDSKTEERNAPASLHTAAHGH